MRKHREQQSRLEVLKAQKNADDMAKMKHAPCINSVSKMLALANRGLIKDRDRDSSRGHSPK